MTAGPSLHLHEYVPCASIWDSPMESHEAQFCDHIASTSLFGSHETCWPFCRSRRALMSQER